MNTHHEPITKVTQRRAALARRDALPPAEREAAAAMLAAQPIPIAIARGAIVAGYAPIRSEIDPRPLMQKLAADGATLALPVVTDKLLPLVFRKWALGDALRPGPYGIAEPAKDAEPVTPDVLLVPLAGFDRTGHRLGYGAGHYDRTIRVLRAHKTAIIGLAFAAQETDNILSAAHDERLDMVLTERGVIEFGV